MLKIRIKGNDRREIRKNYYGHKESFVFDGITYKIDPKCIFRINMLYNGIDYVEEYIK